MTRPVESPSDPVSRMHGSPALVLIALLAWAASSTCVAETETGKFWGGVEVGAGSVRRTAVTTQTDSTFYLAFKGGYVFSDRLLLGVELGGHTLEAGDLWDPSEGAGVSQVFLIAQYYLQPMHSGWYVRAGGGYVSYWDNNPGGLEDSGWGMTAALGYDWRIGSFGAIGPLLSLGYGRAGELDHRAMALALSWSFP